MNRRWMLQRAVAAASLTALAALAGCVVAPARPYAAADVVTVEPPAVAEEAVGVAPGPGHVWVGGYWRWNGARHVWVPGSWVVGRPGYRWEPHAWLRVGGGWRFREGHWVVM